MSISKIIEKFHKNRVKSIKKMSNGYQKDMAIGAFVADLGPRSIKPVAKAIGSCFRKVKKCYLSFVNQSNYNQLSLEFRGRKKVEEKDKKLVPRIEKILECYEQTDSHFKSETLFVDITLTNLRKELINKYGYTNETCPCKTTLWRILNNLGYKIKKVAKTKV